jgi:hypothetical protein
MALDADPSAAISTTQEWAAVRMTGETLDQNLTSTISDEITTNRSFADSKLSEGQIVGGFTFEASYKQLGDLLIPALQGAYDMDLGISPAPGNLWATTDTMANGSSKQCLMFMKRVLVGTTYWYYTYRGCQIDSLSLNMEVGSLVTGSVTLLGIGGAVDSGTAATGPTGNTWTYDTAVYGGSQLMSAVDSISNFSLTDHTDASITATFQSLNLTFSNQMRAQSAVNSAGIYPAGISSGRFMAEISSTIYFQNGTLYTQLINDDLCKLAFDLADSSGNTFNFDFDKLKPQGGVTPLAGGPDQDLLISPTFRAFEDATKGTVTITRTDA